METKDWRCRRKQIFKSSWTNMCVLFKNKYFIQDFFMYSQPTQAFSRIDLLTWSFSLISECLQIIHLSPEIYLVKHIANNVTRHSWTLVHFSVCLSVAAISYFSHVLYLVLFLLRQSAGLVEETCLWGRGDQHDSHGQCHPAPDTWCPQ